jgi:hypothetical protein
MRDVEAVSTDLVPVNGKTNLDGFAVLALG